MTLLKAKITEETFLKPFLAQSAAIKKRPYASMLRPFNVGDTFSVHEHTLEGAHQYVVLESDKSGEFMAGFVYAPDIEIYPNPDSKELVLPLSVLATPTQSKPERNWEDYKHPERPEYADDWDLSMDFPSRIVRYMMDQNWQIHDGYRERNIVYFEGANLNGIPNADRTDEWNDFRCLVSFDEKKKPYFALSPQRATTEPGWHYTDAPMNPLGAFRIALGQHLEGWVVGTHGYDAHPALVQVGMLGHYRDLNKDGSRTGDKFYRAEDTTVNQHWSYTGPDKVGRSSAGCLVGLDHGRHVQFMDLLEKDPQYINNRWFRFDTAVIDASDFAQSQWGYK